MFAHLPSALGGDRGAASGSCWQQRPVGGGVLSGAAVWLCRRVAVTPEGCVPVKPLLSSLLPKQKVLSVQESGKV